MPTPIRCKKCGYTIKLKDRDIKYRKKRDWKCKNCGYINDLTKLMNVMNM